MATYATGITASFCGTTLGEITEIDVQYGGGMPIARGTTAAGVVAEPWALDLGTIEIATLRELGLKTGTYDAYGRKGVLSFGGTAVNQTATTSVVSLGFTTKAVCERLRLTAKIQDVWRYRGTFKIIKE
jgi:hypothetical protein